MVVTLTEFHSMALLHARMAALVEFVLWQQPEPSSTSATFAMPLLVEPLSMRLRTSDVRCRCACRMDVPTFSAGASSKVRSMRSTRVGRQRERAGLALEGEEGTGRLAAEIKRYRIHTSFKPPIELYTVQLRSPARRAPGCILVAFTVVT